MSELEVTPAPENDIPGVKKQVAAKIREMLVKGRRHFGSAGASLTHQLHNPELRGTAGFKPQLVEAGLTGERETSLIIREVMEKYPNAVLCDSVHIRGSENNDELSAGPEDGEIEDNGFYDDGKDTDHVLIIGDHVFIIDSKRWRKKARYTVNDKYQVLRNNKPFPGGNVRASAAKYLWKEYLHDPVSVSSLVVVNNEEVSTFRNKAWFKSPFKLVDIGRFDDLLEKEVKKLKPGSHIRTDLVSQVALSCIAPYDPYKEFLKSTGHNDFY